MNKLQTLVKHFHVNIVTFGFMLACGTNHEHNRITTDGIQCGACRMTCVYHIVNKHGNLAVDTIHACAKQQVWQRLVRMLFLPDIQALKRGTVQNILIRNVIQV